jgi:hypothetical protein
MKLKQVEGSDPEEGSKFMKLKEVISKLPFTTSSFQCGNPSWPRASASNAMSRPKSPRPKRATWIESKSSAGTATL